MRAFESAAVEAWKTCPMCRLDWHSVEDLLRDGDVHFDGIQKTGDPEVASFYLFTHRHPACGSTLALTEDQLGQAREAWKAA